MDLERQKIDDGSHDHDLLVAQILSSKLGVFSCCEWKNTVLFSTAKCGVVARVVGPYRIHRLFFPKLAP
jgi:hypothetical protein